MEPKQILQQMVDRDAGNIYGGVRDLALKAVPKQFKGFAMNYLRSNEKKWLNSIDDVVEMLVDSSFPTQDTTLEEGIENFNALLNGYVEGALEDKLGIQPESLKIIFQMLPQQGMR